MGEKRGRQMYRRYVRERGRASDLSSLRVYSRGNGRVWFVRASKTDMHVYFYAGRNLRQRCIHSPSARLNNIHSTLFVSARRIRLETLSKRVMLP